MRRRVLRLESGKLAGHHVVVWADGSARISRDLDRDELARVLAEHAARDVTPPSPALPRAAPLPRSRRRRLVPVPDWMQVV